MSYWTWIHPKFKFKNKNFLRNEKLLRLEYQRLNEDVYHMQIMGLTFLMTGFNLIGKGIVSLFLIIIGFAILFGGFINDGRAERRYRHLRKIILKTD